MLLILLSNIKNLFSGNIIGLYVLYAEDTFTVLSIKFDLLTYNYAIYLTDTRMLLIDLWMRLIF